MTDWWVLKIHQRQFRVALRSPNLIETKTTLKITWMDSGVLLIHQRGGAFTSVQPVPSINLIQSRESRSLMYFSIIFTQEQFPILLGLSVVHKLLARLLFRFPNMKTLHVTNVENYRSVRKEVYILYLVEDK